jgi:hypothetical protein
VIDDLAMVDPNDPPSAVVILQAAPRDSIGRPELIANLPHVVGLVVWVDLHGERGNVGLILAPLRKLRVRPPKQNHVSIPIPIDKHDAAVVFDRGIPIGARCDIRHWIETEDTKCRRNRTKGHESQQRP